MRQQVSVDEIKDRLLGQLDGLIHRLAPACGDSYTRGDRYFTLNPGRADRRVGSFVIWTSGPQKGRWADYAMAPLPGQRSAHASGDIIDLITLSLGLSGAEAFKWAREFLGLETEDPELSRRRAAEWAARKAEIEAEAARNKIDRAEAEAKTRRTAKGLWLSGQEALIGTPVDFYLRARGIDLRGLPHMPGAIRHHPECRYYWQAEVVDPDTGEVTRRLQHRPLPAMVTAIARGREIIDCHRTYLAFDAQRGHWAKAALHDERKVFTNYTGGSIRLCGAPGPRGGMLKLRQAPEGSRVFVTEGIENALSLIALRQLAGQEPAFVVAAGSIANLATVELPSTVTEVVLAADNDQGEQAQAMLARAVAFHAGLGRVVRIWRSDRPGEDLNDRLQQVLAEGAMQTEGAA